MRGELLEVIRFLDRLTIKELIGNEGRERLGAGGLPVVVWIEKDLEDEDGNERAKRCYFTSLIPTSMLWPPMVWWQWTAIVLAPGLRALRPSAFIGACL